MNVVLIGFMGTGKSAIGRVLARQLNARFIDTDAEIERNAGKSVAQIFAQDGEPAFREMESQLLRKLAQEKGPIVLSTGGGMPLRSENAPLLRRIGPIIWLTAPTEAILGRVRRNLNQRPLLSGHADDPEQRVRRLLTERNPRYRKLANFELDTSNFDRPEQAAAHIRTMLTLHEPSWTPPTAAIGSRQA